MTNSDTPKPLPVGSYTCETLPPASARVKKLVEDTRSNAEAFRKTSEGEALRERAERAYKKGGLADFIGIMLGAKGYEHTGNE